MAMSDIEQAQQNKDRIQELEETVARLWEVVRQLIAERANRDNAN
jgi:tetrahydromethanopterin S-methyltransferase subunit G